MKRFAISAPLCAAVALVISAVPDSAGEAVAQEKGKGHAGGAFHPGSAPKAPAPAPVKTPAPQPPPKVQAPPPIVQRTPAVGSIQPTVKAPAPAPVPVVKQPPPAVKEDVHAFIERNKGKFTGVGEQHAKQVVTKEIVQTSKVVERPSPKATSAVVQAFHKKLGGNTIVVNNKTVNINNQRADLVT